MSDRKPTWLDRVIALGALCLAIFSLGWATSSMIHNDPLGFVMGVILTIVALWFGS